MRVILYGATGMVGAGVLRECLEEPSDCGAQGLRVERADQIDGALQAAFEHDGPSVVEVVADAALV